MKTGKLPGFFGILILLILMATLVSSCISQSKLEYLQDPVANKNVYKLFPQSESQIKPNDELYIRVSSFDDVSFNFFNSQSNSSALSFGTEASIALISYTVNDSGNIYFPIIGNVYVKGLTIIQLTDKLKSLLSEYFNQPTVLVKFVNKKITVIGEVRQPGTYTYTKDRINIFEALGMAGDITLHGNRKDVLLIRTQNDSIIKAKLNLTSDRILQGQDYYLHENDIVYVPSRPSLKWNTVSVPITLVLSTVTTFLLIYNYL